MDDVRRHEVGRERDEDLLRREAISSPSKRLLCSGRKRQHNSLKENLDLELLKSLDISK